jgi:hypothetical protein
MLDRKFPWHGALRIFEEAAKMSSVKNKSGSEQKDPGGDFSWSGKLSRTQARKDTRQAGPNWRPARSCCSQAGLSGRKKHDCTEGNRAQSLLGARAGEENRGWRSAHTERCYKKNQPESSVKTQQNRRRGLPIEKSDLPAGGESTGS